MANCYIKKNLSATSWSSTCSGTYNYNNASWTSGPSPTSASKSLTVTIPSGITATAIAFKMTVSITKTDANAYGSSYNVVVKKGSTTIATTQSTSGNTVTYTLNSLTNATPGTTLTITISQTTTPKYSQSGSGSKTLTCAYSFTSLYLRITCTIPTTETTITAAKLNAFASIFGTTQATQYAAITRTLWQNIGTAVGTMTTTETGTTKKSAVTFNTSQPLSTNLASVISNMTGGYLARS